VTASTLLGYLFAAWLAQLALAAAFAWWRRSTAPARAAEVSTDLAMPAQQSAWPGWREFRVARREFEDAACTQCSFHLEPVDGVPLPAFKPGQFLTFALQLPSDSEARTLTRCYSLSDRPDAKAYRVTIKRVPSPAGRPELPPGASSNHFHDRVHEGDVLRLKAPSGHFFIDPDPAVPAVLIAGGIGITPMMSMLRWCLAEQPARFLHLYYGLRNGAEQAFKATLEALAQAHSNFHLHVVYSQPGPDDLPGRDYQHAGHVDLELLQRTVPHGRHQFYVCGPPPMMQSLVPALAEWGVAAQDIHHEAFGPASVRPTTGTAAEPADSQGVALEIRFSRSGRTLAWDGRDDNLLDFAERHGVAVDSGCRAGSCGSCETKLISGNVRYAQAPDHDLRAGHCLLCVGQPASALVLEA
jgi:hypothetical protein